jgi:hypothetical protein
MELALEHLCHYDAEREDTLNRIVTGDESWVHYFQPKSKHASIQWKHPSSPVTKKFSCPINRQDYDALWYSQGVPLVHFQQPGETIDATLYCLVLQTLRDSICRK